MSVYGQNLGTVIIVIFKFSIIKTIQICFINLFWFIRADNVESYENKKPTSNRNVILFI